MTGAAVGALTEQLRAAGHDPILTPVASYAEQARVTGAVMRPSDVEAGDLFVAVSGARAQAIRN